MQTQSAQRLIYDTPHGMHAAHAHARLTLRGGFERRCWAPAARRVTVGAGSYMHASSVQRAADSVPRTTAATTHRQQTARADLQRSATSPWRRAADGQAREASRAGWRTSQQGGPVRACVLGRRGGSIRTGITWTVESATTAHGPSCSSAVTPHPAHSAGTPAAGAACSSTARINAAVDAPTSPSACTAAVDALASRRCHGFGLRVGCPRLFAHTVAILDNLGKSRE